MSKEITNNDLFELMTKMYADLNEKMEGGFNELKEEIKETNERLTILEDKTDKNFKALYDGYAQNTEQLNRIEKKVDSIEKRVEKNEVQIKVIKGGK